jgi:hypothetical protein
MGWYSCIVILLDIYFISSFVHVNSIYFLNKFFHSRLELILNTIHLGLDAINTGLDLPELALHLSLDRVNRLFNLADSGIQSVINFMVRLVDEGLDNLDESQSIFLLVFRVCLSLEDQHLKVVDYTEGSLDDEVFLIEVSSVHPEVDH